MGFTDQEIDGGGLRVTTTFTRNAMDAAAQAVRDQKPQGLQAAARRGRLRRPATGALRGIYAGQDYLESQLNWAVAGGSPGSAFKPFALAAGLDDGYSLKSTFERQLALRVPQRRPRSSTRDRATATTTARRSA